ncbi:MAG: PH domain-containing protein [Methanothermobacter sp.]
MEREASSYVGEKVLFDTRPRFTLNIGSTIIKIIILLLFIYFFTTILALTAQVQEVLIYYIQLPLVQGVSYILLLIVIILFLSIIWDIVSWRSIHYMLTTRRILIVKGILRKKKIYMPYDKIQDIDVSQGLLERLFKAGDIEIYGGHEHTQVIMEDVPNPYQVDNTINRLMQGEDIGFRKYKRHEDRKSVIDEYDRKFK